MQPLFLPRRQLGRQTVRHGDQLDEEEVKAGRVYLRGGGVEGDVVRGV